MNLYLVRHADAEKTQPGKRDHERKLTIEGRKSIEYASDRWKHFINHLDHICTSPYTRAVETAEIIAEAFEYNSEIIKDKVLSAGSNTKDLVELVNALEGNDILIVGHQPDLSQHLSNLISSRSASIEFRKTALAKISFNGKASFSRGYLEYLIPAEVFSK
jgi:phosphohistidine phosphatase